MNATDGRQALIQVLQHFLAREFDAAVERGEQLARELPDNPVVHVLVLASARATGTTGAIARATEGLRCVLMPDLYARSQALLAGQTAEADLLRDDDDASGGAWLLLLRALDAWTAGRLRDCIRDAEWVWCRLTAGAERSVARALCNAAIRVVRVEPDGTWAAEGLERLSEHQPRLWEASEGLGELAAREGAEVARRRGVGILDAAVRSFGSDTMLFALTANRLGGLCRSGSEEHITYTGTAWGVLRRHLGSRSAITIGVWANHAGALILAGRRAEASAQTRALLAVVEPFPPSHELRLQVAELARRLGLDDEEGLDARAWRAARSRYPAGHPARLAPAVRACADALEATQGLSEDLAEALLEEAEAAANGLDRGLAFVLLALARTSAGLPAEARRLEQRARSALGSIRPDPDDQEQLVWIEQLLAQFAQLHARPGAQPLGEIGDGLAIEPPERESCQRPAYDENAIFAAYATRNVEEAARIGARALVDPEAPGRLRRIVLIALLRTQPRGRADVVCAWLREREARRRNASSQPRSWSDAMLALLTGALEPTELLEHADDDAAVATLHFCWGHLLAAAGSRRLALPHLLIAAFLQAGPESLFAHLDAIDLLARMGAPSVLAHLPALLSERASDAERARLLEVAQRELERQEGAESAESAESIVSRSVGYVVAHRDALADAIETARSGGGAGARALLGARLRELAGGEWLDGGYLLATTHATMAEVLAITGDTAGAEAHLDQARMRWAELGGAEHPFARRLTQTREGLRAGRSSPPRRPLSSWTVADTSDIRFFRNLVSELPEGPSALMAGASATLSGRFREAASFARAALAAEPSQDSRSAGRAWMLLCVSLLALDEREQALDANMRSITSFMSVGADDMALAYALALRADILADEEGTDARGIEAEVDQLFAEAIRITERAAPTSVEHAEIRRMQAHVLLRRGELGRAEAATAAGVEAAAGSLSPDSYLRATLVLLEAEVRRAQGDAEGAFSLWCSAEQGKDASVRATLVGCAAADRVLVLAELRKFLGFGLSLAALDGQRGARAYDVVLRRKAIDLALGHRRSQLPHEELAALHSGLRSARRTAAAARQAWLSGEGERARALEAEALDAERELAAHYPATLLASGLLDVGARSVASTLVPGELLLEFVETLREDERLGRRSRSLLSHLFVVQVGGDDPRAIRVLDIGPTSEVTAQVIAFRDAILEDDAPRVQRLGRELTARLFGSLLDGDARPTRLFIAADGPLWWLPFEALPDAYGEPLIESVDVRHLPCGRELMRPPSARAGVGGALVLGDPVLTAGEPGAAPPLPGARAEALIVARRLGTEAVLGSQATRATLLSARGPALVHLAVHGYTYFVAPTDASQQAKAEPRQGLALAAGPSDLGLFTVEDAASLDLDGTRLVVLAACWSGLGPFKPLEGVFGLQRSFLAAGAQTVVVTLWGASDVASAILMDDLYRRIEDGDPPVVALRGAKRALRKLSTSELARQLRAQEGIARLPEGRALLEELLLVSRMRKVSLPFSGVHSWAPYTAVGVGREV